MARPTCCRGHSRVVGCSDDGNSSIAVFAALPSIFCHFLTRVPSLLMAGLLSEAEVLAPGVPAFEIMKPYLSVLTLIGVFATASDVASAAMQTVSSLHCQEHDRC